MKSMPSLPVRISGITVRNLKNISIEFLPGEIVLLTGVSGSGKSSLAFDTVYAAGRKRYISTLPSFLRRLYLLYLNLTLKASKGYLQPLLLSKIILLITFMLLSAVLQNFPNTLRCYFLWMGRLEIL